MDEVLDRIEKLQRLAGNNPSTQEAEAAAAKVQTLLLKHNLSLADVAARGESLGEISMMELPAQDSIWRAKLLGVVANAHLCRAVRTVNGMGMPTTFTILGHPHNLRVVQSVYPWLAELVPAVALSATLIHQMDVMTIGREEWLHSFRLGMIDGIADAYDAARESLNDETGLVPIDDAVQKALEEAFPDVQEHRFGGEADLHAYGAGRKAGRAVNPDHQIGGPDAKRIDRTSHPARAHQPR